MRVKPPYLEARQHRSDCHDRRSSPARARRPRIPRSMDTDLPRRRKFRRRWCRSPVGTSCICSTRSTAPVLAALPSKAIADGRAEILKALDPSAAGAPRTASKFRRGRSQGRFRRDGGGEGSAAQIHNVQIALQASALGPALKPCYSFYSITEVSEYVPDAEEYGRILRDQEGVDPESNVYKTKVAAYAERLGPMNQQRLYPDFRIGPACVSIR